MIYDGVLAMQWMGGCHVRSGRVCLQLVQTLRMWLYYVGNFDFGCYLGMQLFGIVVIGDRVDMHVVECVLVGSHLFDEGVEVGSVYTVVQGVGVFGARERI